MPLGRSKKWSSENRTNRTGGDGPDILATHHMTYYNYYRKDPGKKDIMDPWNDISNDPPKGLCAPADKSITISFHVLVPLDLWGWDATSKMHIHFDHKDLGAWNCNCGDFQEIGLVLKLLCLTPLICGSILFVECLKSIVR